MAQRAYKVYLKNRLHDIVYANNGTTPEDLKAQLVKEGYKQDIVVKHYINIKERKL